MIGKVSTILTMKSLFIKITCSDRSTSALKSKCVLLLYGWTAFHFCQYFITCKPHKQCKTYFPVQIHMKVMAVLHTSRQQCTWNDTNVQLTYIKSRKWCSKMCTWTVGIMVAICFWFEPYNVWESQQCWLALSNVLPLYPVTQIQRKATICVPFTDLLLYHHCMHVL